MKQVGKCRDRVRGDAELLRLNWVVGVCLAGASMPERRSPDGCEALAVCARGDVRAEGTGGVMA